MSDLVLTRRAKRFTSVLTVFVIGGVGMTMIVFADNNNWAVAWSLAVVFGFAIYFLGTPAYRVSMRAPGKVQLNTMLGAHQVDLTKGFTVKQGRLGKPTVWLRAGKKRYRMNGALGGSKQIDEWMTAVANAS